MALNNKSSRQSLFSTPQATRNPSSCVRRSLSQINLKEPKETLFTTMMNDPLKKALLMQLLANHKSGDKDVMELMQRKKDEEDKLTKPKNAFSPMSVHRKKVLAAHERVENGSTKAYSRAAIPFNKLLSGVVAYVEIISKGQDRSTGVKALLKTMGGRVSEFICKGITHAIIKDVSYETYKRANMVKAQLVSVLWLEAVRKNHCRVPEKHYPALGPQAYTSNVSLLCEELQQEYAEVVKDELECSRNLQKKMRLNLSTCFGEDVINSSISGDSSSINSGIETIFHHSKEENKENSQYISSDKDENFSDYNSANDSDILVKTPSMRRCTSSKKDSINLGVSSESNKKTMAASESIESLRISSGSSKRRTTASSALSSLRVSTESNKSRREPNKVVAASESIESLRISSNSSKRRTTASSALSSLRVSTESNKSKKGIASEPIESLRLSSNSSNRRLTRRSSALYSSCPKSNINANSVSKPTDSLEISLSSSKRKTPESAAALSSLRVSLSSDSSKEIGDVELSRRSSRRLKKKMTSSFETSNEDNNSNDGNLSPDIPIQRDIYANVTERKKRRLTRLNLSFEEYNCAGSQLEDEDNVKLGRKSSSNSNNPRAKKLFKSIIENSSSPKSKSSKKTKIVENKPNVTERQRRRTRLNFSSSDENSCIDDSMKEDESKKNLKENLDISSILLTPSAKKLIENLQNTPSNNDFSKKTDIVEKKSKKGQKRKLNDQKNLTKNSEISSGLETSTAKKLLKHLHNSSSENDCDKSQKDENKPKVIRKRKLYNENDNNFLPQWTENKDNLTNKTETPAVLTTPNNKRNPENTNNLQKTKTADDNLFKTPGKPVKSRNVDEKKFTHSPSQSVRVSQRIRRSTLDFLPKEPFRTPKKSQTPIKPKKITSIVCSRFHTKEVLEFEEIVQKLGSFVIDHDVTEKTSHLVLAEPKRTINALRAMARGCWILKSEWLFKSLKAGEWLPEENYEMTEFSQAVQKSRQERQAFGGHYAMDVFSDCGKIYIAKKSSPQCSDLQDLVKVCNGKITMIRRNADVIVGEYVDGNVKCVKENWILDCIQFYKTQSFKSYLLISPS